jgi:hypothetical protein
LSANKRADFSPRKIDHARREEIAAQLGSEDEYFADLKIACYKLNKLKRRRLWLCFGVLPFGVSRDPDGLEVAMIQFDKDDRALKVAIRSVPPQFYFELESATGSYEMKPDEARHLMRESAQEWSRQK